MFRISSFEKILLVFDVLIPILTLITSIHLIIKGYFKKQKNLKILGLTFLFISISLAIRAIYSLIWVQVVFFQSISYLFLVYFIDLTFYQGIPQKKRGIQIIRIFLCYILSSLFAFLYIRYNQNYSYLYNIASFFDLLLVLFTMGRVFKPIKIFLKSVEKDKIWPYIYKRLELMKFLTYLYIFYYSLWQLELFSSNQTLYFILDAINSICGLIYIIGMFFAWVMPRWFENFLNKGWKENASDVISEDELKKRIRRDC